MEGVKGYKAFNADMTCRGFKYEVGKVYVHDGPISICDSGFHFCERAVDVFDYYKHDRESTVICEVTALGKVETDGDKSVTDRIEVGRMLSWEEVHVLANTGKDNTGIKNIGNRNSGNWNNGNGNSGDWNIGNWNSGNGNSGDWNSGNGNSGNRNSGDWNSGNGNSGDWNSGDWNSGYGNSGAFCTDENKILIFDEPTELTLCEWHDSEAYSILCRVGFDTTEWVDESGMTDGEKTEHPEFYCQGGYLKKINSGYRFSEWWEKLDDREKAVIKSIPNFDAAKFLKITGLDVR